MKNRRILSLLAAALALTMLFSGCSSKSTGKETVNSANNSGGDLYATEGNVDGAFLDESAGGENAAAGRKLIRTIEITAETEDFDTLMTTVSAKISALGGYLEESDVYNGGIRENTNRSASLVIRIPAVKLDEFVSNLAESSNIVCQSENQRDVTLQYVDTESRKKALEIEQDRLLALLEKADTLSDIITLEERLTSVRYELENMASTLRTYDNQVEYGTVYLRLQEVKELTPVEEPGFWERIGDGFLNSLESLGTMIAELFAGLIILLPYLFLPLMIAVIAILFSRKKRRKKANASTNPPEETK